RQLADDGGAVQSVHARHGAGPPDGRAVLPQRHAVRRARRDRPPPLPQPAHLVADLLREHLLPAPPTLPRPARLRAVVARPEAVHSGSEPGTPLGRSERPVAGGVRPGGRRPGQGGGPAAAGRGARDVSRSASPRRPFFALFWQIVTLRGSPWFTGVCGEG